jgi:hypothetical protein
MFLDLITTTRAEVDIVDREAGLFSDPPEGLLAALAWEAEGADPDGEVTVLTVWATPGARGDRGYQRIMPLAGSGAVTGEPAILTPYRTFVRGSGPGG